MNVGDKASLKKTFTSKDVELFSSLTLDDNPVHLDEDYAQKSPFGRRIVHGVLVGGLVSAVIGTKLPGKGAIYLAQSFSFKKPVYLEDEVTAHVTVIESRSDKPIVKLLTQCKNQNGDVVLEGEAIVKYPK